jgi:DNA (cytosine-5)-methyltransferase 1
MDIRSLRIHKQLQQRQLAAMIGVSLGELKKWERGLDLVPSKQLASLADVFGVDSHMLSQGQQCLVRSPAIGEGYSTAKAKAPVILEREQSVPANKLRVLDLFCGAGGLSFGFEQTGNFVTTGGIDLLADRIETFTRNHPAATGIAADIINFPSKNLSELASHPDVVVGGPPCQGFSSIRPFRTLTEGDPRNNLAEHYVLLINQLKPRWFVFENVVGLLTHENGERLSNILEGLRGTGYRVDWRVINAANFGVPQNRERIIIVGSRDGLGFLWPSPTHFYQHKSMAGSRPEVVRTNSLFDAHLPEAITVMEAIGDLPPVKAGTEATAYDPAFLPTAYQQQMRAGSEQLSLHRATSHSEKMLNIIRHAGANIHALPPGMVTSGFSSCYSRLDANEPSTTLTVNFVHPASNRCIHPTQQRALTPREGARIQSFPDRFIFCGTSAQIVKQIGNAVPPLIGEIIAKAIIQSELAANNHPLDSSSLKAS